MENVVVGHAPVRLRRPARLLRLTSDERLVALVRDGDEGAFEALYDRHHPAILGFCRHMLGTREEAEDAVQHTFLAAFRDLVGSDKPIDLRPWLFAIARNRCLSLLRARRAHVAIELVEPATDGLAATVERREDLRELLADLAGLPEDQRAALLLAELGALDHAGIATVLGCPREKVKALVFQARTSLAASREARAMPCEDIRVELATATGGALRRGALRRHLRTCDGCRAFKAEVATQHKLLALALPVVPTVALKASVLAGGSGGAQASGGGAAAAASAGAAGTSSGSTFGALGTIVSTGAGKVAVTVAVAGAVAGGGALSGQLEQQSPAHAVPVPSSARPAHVAPPHPLAATRLAHGGTASRLPAGRSGAAPSQATHAPAVVVPASGSPAVAPASPAPAVVPAPPAQVPTPGAGGNGVARQPARHGHAPASPAPTGGVRHRGTQPGGSAPPRHAQGKGPTGAAHGRAHEPHGHAKAPPAHGRAPAAPRPHADAGPPAVVPSHGKPSQTPTVGNGPQQSGPPTAPPGRSGHATSPSAGAGEPSHGQAGMPHGQSGSPHGHAG